MGDPAERYVIRIARTVLRPVSIGDVDELQRVWIHPDVGRHFWDDEVITPERAEAAVREAVEGLGRHAASGGSAWPAYWASPTPRTPLLAACSRRAA